MSEDKMEWMYKNSNEVVDKEEYLLGRRIDKSFEGNESKNTGDSIPKSLLLSSSDAGVINVDAIRKRKEDPLEAIREKEIEMRKQLLKNPVQMKKLRQMIEKQEKNSSQPMKKSKKSKSKKKKNKKKERKESSESDDDLDDALTSKLKELIKKYGKETVLNLKSSSKKSKGKSSSEEESSSDSTEESDDSKHSNQKDRRNLKAVKSNRKRLISESTSSSDSENSIPKDDKNRRHDSGQKRLYNKESRKPMNEPDASTKNSSRTRSRSPFEKLSNKNKREERTRKSDSKSKFKSNSRRDDRTLQRTSDVHKKADSKIGNYIRTNSDDDLRGKEVSRRRRSRSREKPKDTSYGLSVPKSAVRARSQIDASSSRQRDDEEAARKRTVGGSTSNRPDRKKLSDSEKEKKLKEMMSNVSWRNEMRESNIKRYKHDEEKEKKSNDVDYDENFISRELAKASYQSTMEQRIKSNVHNIQRSSFAMDKNFAKRD